MTDYVLFILSHGRPGNIKTLDSLKKSGFTGDYRIIIDNEDKTAEKYYQLYGDKVIMFDKKKESKNTDTFDLIPDRNIVLFARNACFRIAENLGYTYFIQMDDDYTHFYYRVDNNNKYVTKNIPIIKNITNIFSYFFEYYKSTNFLSIAMAQNGDFIGGSGNDIFDSLGRRRKCMNSFFCSTKRPFKFIGRLNEDVNVYTKLGSMGFLFITIPFVSLSQCGTQQQKGGLTDSYLENGTYVKSFYSVMLNPSFVKIYTIKGSTQRSDKHKVNTQRYHHQISWKNAVPCIINEKYKIK